MKRRTLWPEYLFLVFFLRTAPSRAGWTARAILDSFCQTGCTLPPAAFVARRRGNKVPPGWKANKYGFPVIQRRANINRQHLDDLADLPQGAESIEYESIPTGSKEPLLDFNYRITFSMTSRKTKIHPSGHCCSHDRVADPTIAIAIRTEIVNEWGEERSRLLVDDIVRNVAMHTSAYYGMVHVEDSTRTIGFTVYSPLLDFSTYVPYTPVQEQAWWGGAIDRRRAAYRVHWGNYLGRDFVAAYEKHGGCLADDFAGAKTYDLRSASQLENGHYALELNGGAVFLAASESPLDVSYHVGWGGGIDSRDTQMMAWLHRQLRKRGMLA